LQQFEPRVVRGHYALIGRSRRGLVDASDWDVGRAVARRDCALAVSPSSARAAFAVGWDQRVKLTERRRDHRPVSARALRRREWKRPRVLEHHRGTAADRLDAAAREVLKTHPEVELKTLQPWTRPGAQRIQGMRKAALSAIASALRIDTLNSRRIGAPARSSTPTTVVRKFDRPEPYTT